MQHKLVSPVPILFWKPINYEFTTTYSHVPNVTTLFFTVFYGSATSLHT